MIAIATLLAPITAAQARAAAVTKLVSYGIPANNWRPGGVFSTLLTVYCWLFSSFTSLVTAAINGMFLGTASGGWLTALAFYVYGVRRQAATFGTTSYTLTNVGGGVYSFAAGQAQFQCSLNGNLFTNQGAFSLAAGSPSSPTTATFTIVASAPGSLGGAPANQITTLVTTFAAGVTGTNAAACLGADAWSDGTVVAACYAALAARSQLGPTGAYYAAIYGFSNVPGATNSVTGQPVNVNRIQVYTDQDTGAITVYVASPAGVADANDVTGIQTAILAIAQPQGITATAASCTVVDFTAAITVWSTSAGPAAAASIKNGSLTAVDDALAVYPIGGRIKSGTQGYLFASFITGQVVPVDPSIFSVDLASWTKLPLNAGQVAALTSTVTVSQVPQ